MKVKYCGKSLFFKAENINEVKYLILEDIPCDDMVFVSLPDDNQEPREIFKWALQANELTKCVPHFRRLIHASKTRRCIRVIYKGKINGLEHFDIAQRVCTNGEWLPIEYNLEHIQSTDRGSTYSIQTPANIGRETICCGRNVETAMKVRDFLRKEGYPFDDLRPYPKAQISSSKLEEYVQTHDTLRFDEIKKLFPQ